MYNILRFDIYISLDIDNSGYNDPDNRQQK